VIFEIAQADHPLTCRQCFYRLVAAGVIEKTQATYRDTVCRLMAEMRRDGSLPWSWVADSTRVVRRPRTCHGLGQMLQRSLETYRRAVWDDQPAYVEVWCESDSVAGVLADMCRQWDVPLLSARGFCSVTYLHAAAQAISVIGKPAFLYYFGDYDPSGLHIDRRIEADLREFAPDADLTFTRVAVTADQIEELNLPGAPPKTTDSRTKSFPGGKAVEIESIASPYLRSMCQNRITSHLDSAVYSALLMTESAERETLEKLVEGFGQAG